MHLNNKLAQRMEEDVRKLTLEQSRNFENHHFQVLDSVSLQMTYLASSLVLTEDIEAAE